MTNPITTSRQAIIAAIKDHEATAGKFRRLILFDTGSNAVLPEPGVAELPAVLITHLDRGRTVASSGTNEITVYIEIRIWEATHDLDKIEELLYAVLRATKMNRDLSLQVRMQQAEVGIRQGRLKPSEGTNEGHPVTQARVVLPVVIRIC